MNKKDFIALSDYDKDTLKMLVERAIELKKGSIAEKGKNKALALIFTKASTRTNVSFQRAIQRLGGHSIYLGADSLQLSRGESIADTARTLSRFVDAIMIRTYDHQDVVDLAQEASVPVINGLTDFLHPCQALCDVMTIQEVKGDNYEDIKVVYVGDGNNVCNSLINAAGVFGYNFTAAVPEGYEPNAALLSQMKQKNNHINVINDPGEAVTDADVIYTDVWVSMGDEKEAAERKKKFMKYQVNSELVSKAKADVMIMHCLPAHRGEEITADVIDGENSYVFDQAENRMHIQQAILEFCL
jgi:ornithine carbamoyltransferase